MQQRADLIKLYTSNGITNIRDIRNHYNSFATGGPIKVDEYGYPADITPAVVTQDAEFNKFLMTLPDNQRLTPEEDYHTYQYWKIKGRPKDFSEALNLGMYNYDSSDNSYHANSVAFDNKGVGHFMKPKHHSTVKYELDWYNKGVGTLEGGEQYPLQGDERKEWEDFRSRYQLDSTGIDYKYVPKKHYNSFGDGGYTDTTQYYDNTYIEPAVSKAFDSTEDYNRYKGEQFGKSITTNRDKLANKIGTLAYDVAQLHPTVGTGLDIAEVIMKRGSEEILPSLMSTDGKLVSLINKIGKSNKVGMGTVFGKILQFPDMAFDVLKLIEDFKKPLNQYGEGGPTEEGGYSDKSKWYREVRHSKLDPAGGLGIDQLFYLSNHSKGDEDQYWRAYLGLENNLPKMNPSSKTEWDDKIEAEKIANGELPSDFYGTTNNMDLYIQAMADTTTTGKIVRNYDEFKKLNPTLSPKKEIEAMYRSGKAMMDNPNKWTQVGEVKGSAQLDIERKLNDGEEYPLGMLASFGAKWIPEENTVHIHDTYDFPWYSRVLGRIPERPKEMKIRGKVKYNPKKQAKIFNADNFNLNFPK